MTSEAERTKRGTHMGNRNASGLCLFLVIATILAGCGLTSSQRKEIEAFGLAASTLGASSKEQLNASRDEVIDMKRYRLAIEKVILDPKKAKESGIPARDYYFSNVLDLDAGLDRNAIASRVAAVDVLEQYGKLLMAFTTDQHEKEVKEASNKFAKSVGDFPQNPMTAEEIEGLDHVLTSVGGILVEHRKKEALEKVVPMVAPLIDKICGSLERDFDPTKPGVYGTVDTVQNRLGTTAVDGLKALPDSMSDRLLLIDGFALAQKNKAGVGTMSARMLKSIASLRKANAQLPEVIKSHKVGFKDIKEFGENAGDLAKGMKPYLKRF